MPNLYQILNVDPFASTAEISEAVQKLIDEWNPDILDDRKTRVIVTAVLKEITDARDVLTDSWKRQKYDVKIGLADIVYRNRKPRKLTSDKSVQYGYDYGQPLGDILERVRKRSLEALESGPADKGREDTTFVTKTRGYETDTTRVITKHHRDIFYITGKEKDTSEEKLSEGFEKLDRRDTSVDFTSDIRDKTQSLDVKLAHMEKEIKPLTSSQSKEVALNERKYTEDFDTEHATKFSKKGERRSGDVTLRKSLEEGQKSEETVKDSIDIHPSVSKQIIPPKTELVLDEKEKTVKDDQEKKHVKEEVSVVPEVVTEDKGKTISTYSELHPTMAIERITDIQNSTPKESRELQPTEYPSKAEKMVLTHSEKTKPIQVVERSTKREDTEVTYPDTDKEYTAEMEVKIIQEKIHPEEIEEKISKSSLELFPTASSKDSIEPKQIELREIKPVSVSEIAVGKERISDYSQDKVVSAPADDIKEGLEVSEEMHPPPMSLLERKMSVSEYSKEITPAVIRERTTKEEENILKDSFEPKHKTDAEEAIERDLKASKTDVLPDPSIKAQKTIIQPPKQSQAVISTVVSSDLKKVSKEDSKLLVNADEVSRRLQPSPSVTYSTDPLKEDMKDKERLSSTEDQKKEQERFTKHSEEMGTIGSEEPSIGRHGTASDIHIIKSADAIDPRVKVSKKIEDINFVIPSERLVKTENVISKSPKVVLSTKEEDYTEDSRKDVFTNEKVLPFDVSKKLENKISGIVAKDTHSGITEKPSINMKKGILEYPKRIHSIKSADSIDPRKKWSKDSKDIPSTILSDLIFETEEKISIPTEEMGSTKRSTDLRKTVSEDSRSEDPSASLMIFEVDEKISIKTSVDQTHMASKFSSEMHPTVSSKVPVHSEGKISKKLFIDPREKVKKISNDTDPSVTSKIHLDVEERLSPKFSTDTRKVSEKISREMHPTISFEVPVQAEKRVIVKSSTDLKGGVAETLKDMHPTVLSKVPLQAEEKINAKPSADQRTVIRQTSRDVYPNLTSKFLVQAEEKVNAKPSLDSRETTRKISRDIHPTGSSRVPVQIEEIINEPPTHPMETIKKTSRDRHPTVSSRVPVQIEERIYEEQPTNSKETIKKTSRDRHPTVSSRVPVQIEERIYEEPPTDPMETIKKTSWDRHPTVSSRVPVQIEERIYEEPSTDPRETIKKTSRDRHPTVSSRVPVQIEERIYEEPPTDPMETIKKTSWDRHPTVSSRVPVQIEERIYEEPSTDPRETIKKTSWDRHPTVSSRVPVQIEERINEEPPTDPMETIKKTSRDRHPTVSSRVPVQIQERIYEEPPTDPMETIKKISRDRHPTVSSRAPVQIEERIYKEPPTDPMETIKKISRDIHPTVSSRVPVQIEEIIYEEPSTDRKEATVKISRDMQPSVSSKTFKQGKGKISTEHSTDVRESITKASSEIHSVMSVKHPPVPIKEIISRKYDEVYPGESAEDIVVVTERNLGDMKETEPARLTKFPSVKETKILKEQQPVMIKKHDRTRKKVSKDLTAGTLEHTENKLSRDFKEAHSADSFEKSFETKGKDIKYTRSKQPITISERSMEGEKKISKVPSDLHEGAPLKFGRAVKDTISKNSEEFFPTFVSEHSSDSREKLLEDSKKIQPAASSEFILILGKKQKDIESISDSKHLDSPMEDHQKIPQYSKDIQPITITERTIEPKKKISKESGEFSAKTFMKHHAKSKKKVPKSEAAVPLDTHPKLLRNLKMKSGRESSELQSVIPSQQLTERKLRIRKYSDDELQTTIIKLPKEKSKKIPTYSGEIHSVTISEHSPVSAKKISKDLERVSLSVSSTEQKKAYSYPSGTNLEQLPIEKRTSKKSKKIYPTVKSKPSVDIRILKDECVSTEFKDEDVDESSMKPEAEMSYWKKAHVSASNEYSDDDVKELRVKPEPEMSYWKKAHASVSTEQIDEDVEESRMIPEADMSYWKKFYTYVPTEYTDKDVEESPEKRAAEMSYWKKAHVSASTEYSDDDVEESRLQPEADMRYWEKAHASVSTEFTDEDIEESRKMKPEADMSYWKKAQKVDENLDSSTQKSFEKIYKKKKHRKSKIDQISDGIEYPIERKIKCTPKYDNGTIMANDNGTKHRKYLKEQQKYPKIKDEGDVEDYIKRKKEHRDDKRQFAEFHKQPKASKLKQEYVDEELPVRSETEMVKDAKHVKPSSETYQPFQGSRMEYEEETISQISDRDRGAAEFRQYPRISKSIYEPFRINLGDKDKESYAGQRTYWVKKSEKEDDVKSGKFSVKSRDHLAHLGEMSDRYVQEGSSDSRTELRRDFEHFSESRKDITKREKKKKSKNIKEGSAFASETLKDTYEREEVGEHARTISTLESSFMAISVSACSKDSETRTVYTYDIDGERIEVFVEGVKRIHISKMATEESYSSRWTNSDDDSSCFERLRSSTVIDANGSRIVTFRVCDGRQESISVHKDHILLCKVSSSMNS